MARYRKRPPLGMTLYLGAMFALGFYFTFASVQGDFGLFRRIEIDAELRALTAEMEGLEAQLADYRNRTHRLSDGYLDLDLLDERAREVLGYVRVDEVVLR
ncbi:septum formation initiator family protein [Palleronia sediminis]|uniref:Septum formation initiator family protein n=1 Tax=Palleronia sediminis TaxID=2547833 RepID=A0A4R6AEA5_9RHOB|nr:septum formation initiator family protein [Palleronia sediminis]TDL79563.1 septum formation initiator family protein [Palleronia sediminis]